MKYLILVFCFFISSFAFAQELSPQALLKGYGTIYRAKDGDTIQVNINDPSVYQRLKTEAQKDPDRLKYLIDKYQSFVIRIASVNTEESVHRDKSKNTKRGKAISNIIKGLVTQKETEFWCYDFGYYGRAICNVKVFDYKNGEPYDFDLGGYLISNGFSDYITDFGQNPLYNKEYQKLSK